MINDIFVQIILEVRLFVMVVWESLLLHLSSEVRTMYGKY